MATKGKQKPAAAPAAVDTVATLEDLFTKLDGHIKKNEFKRVVKTADEILAKAPKDQDAFAAKVVALIQQGETAAALSAIQGKANPGTPLLLEKAYCLYRDNKLAEARVVLDSAVEPSEGVLQLLGQVLYRIFEHDRCIDMYEKLLTLAPSTSPEVKSNVVAAYVSGGRASEVSGLLTRLKIKPRDSFDLAYNTACASIDRGDLPGAEELLLLAQRVGRETLIEEELPEDEVEDELTPLVVQLAYVQQLQGKTQEAMEGYHGILKRRPSDAPSAAVASNNLITLRGKKDLFDSLKRFDRVIEKNAAGKPQLADALALKLSPRQKEALFFNRFLLLLHSNKLDQAGELVPVLYEAFPKHDAPALLHAALLLQEKKAGKAEELLTEHKEKSTGGSLAAQLVLSQAAAMTGNFRKAADVLGAVKSIQHQPGTVATLVALRERSGDVAGAEAALDAAISWWDSHMGEADASQTLETLTREAADFKLRHGRHRAAADTYKRLVRSSTPSVRADAITGLVASTAHFDPVAAEGYEAELPPLPGVSGLDVAGLERTAAAAAAAAGAGGKKAKGGADGEAVGQKRPGADLEGKKKKRKKKVRYPKGYDAADPGPPPDPERWLPRRERASNKKRNKKKEVNVRGAQGASSKDAAFAAAESSAPEPAKAAAAAKPTPPPAAANKNKKKGKGRK